MMKKALIVLVLFNYPMALSINLELEIKTNKIVQDIITKNNYLIQMAGNFQKEFTHEIPIEKKVKEVRYSFTFRTHLV